MIKKIKIGGFEVKNDNKLFLIAGPCVIENRDHALYHAKMIKQICDELSLDFVFKSSFDKANRTNINSSRGVGIEKGLDILNEIKNSLNVPVLTDVHESYQCDLLKEVVDIIQIPAFLCRQTDLLVAAAKTNKIIKYVHFIILSRFLFELLVCNKQIHVFHRVAWLVFAVFPME